MLNLSQRLERSVSPGFLRLLGGKTAPVYIDCAEQLVEAAGESSQLTRREARALVEGVVVAHAALDWSEEDGTPTADQHERVIRVLNQLRAAGWLEDHCEGLHEHWVVIAPALRPLLRMLQELSAEEVSGARSFADTLGAVCATLENPNRLNPATQGADELRGTVGDLIQRLELAVSQLHGAERIVHIHERRQLLSEGAAETLRGVLSDFPDGSHMVCHEALHGRGLLARLARARDTVRTAMADPAVQQRLAEALAGGPDPSDDLARLRADQEMRKLLRLLDGIHPRADSMNARVASFHQLSRQRYFYQSQLQSRRREWAKALCDAVNARWAGKRFSDLDGPPCFVLSAPEVKFYHGTRSLRRPRGARPKVSLALGTSALALPDEAELARLRAQQRLALTPWRAARLVRRLMPARGDAVSTGEMNLAGNEALLDLIAAASFDHWTSATERLHWEVILDPQRRTPLPPEAIPRDPVAHWHVESFQLRRTI